MTLPFPLLDIHLVCLHLLTQGKIDIKRQRERVGLEEEGYGCFDLWCM